MIAMGQIQRPTLGHEASGIVRRVGDKVTRLTPGDRVIYMGVGAMRTHIRSHESCVHTLPENLTLEEGVTIPIAYATAYQSLVEVARMQKGESVLIHAAAGGKTALPPPNSSHLVLSSSVVFRPMLIPFQVWAKPSFTLQSSSEPKSSAPSAATRRSVR